jgi:proline iminopeptidase
VVVQEFVDVGDGARLWTDSGYPSGASVAMVLVHGGPGLWDYLGPVAALADPLAVTHRFDQRGCGRSFGTRGFTLAGLLGDLEALRAHFGHQRWVVFGHSFGATVALEYAAGHPQAVAGLVYCSGVGFGDRWRSEYRTASEARLAPAQRARRDRLGGSQRSWAEEVEWRQLCWLPDYADPTSAAAWALQDASVELAINWDFHHALRTDVDRLDEAGQRTRCQNVTCPALVLHGAGDPRPSWSAAEVAEAIPHADFVEIPGAGHYPWREQPDLTRDHLQAFLTTTGDP